MNKKQKTFLAAIFLWLEYTAVFWWLWDAKIIDSEVVVSQTDMIISSFLVSTCIWLIFWIMVGIYHALGHEED